LSREEANELKFFRELLNLPGAAGFGSGGKAVGVPGCPGFFGSVFSSLSVFCGASFLSSFSSGGAGGTLTSKKEGISALDALGPPYFAEVPMLRFLFRHLHGGRQFWALAALNPFINSPSPIRLNGLVSENFFESGRDPSVNLCRWYVAEKHEKLSLQSWLRFGQRN
jgi:hypothetical protein